MTKWLFLAVLVVGSVGCPHKGASNASGGGLEGFVCNGRRVEYAVVGGFVAAESGVSVDCANDHPKLTKWRVDGGDRKTDTFELSGDQFETLWNKIDASGWRFLEEDCQNVNAADDDPAYTIDIADHATSVTLLCSGKELPFPYNRLVNELDLRAAGFGNEAQPN